MKVLKTNKRLSKTEREDAILIALVELFIKTNKPVGSSSLQEKLHSLSPATIRNYFVKLEEKGFLKQQHSSGGRIPTYLAYKEYASIYENNLEKEEKFLSEKLKKETKEVTSFLHMAAELLSETLSLATFISSPHFDQDFIQDVKLIQLDKTRILCISITEFGQIKTEMLYLNEEINNLKNIENFFLWRLNKASKPFFQTEKDLKLAQHLYNEAMLRHFIGYNASDIYRTGLSKLLSYPEFKDTSLLADSLSLIENPIHISRLIKESAKKDGISYFIGDDLKSFGTSEIAIALIPYYINQTAIGSIAILGPIRMNYKEVFSTLHLFSKYISETLTKSVYKFKISFKAEESFKNKFLSYNNSILLEDKNRSRDVKKTRK